MHAQLFHQFPLARDAIQIADQQNAQQQLGISGRPFGLAIAVLQLLPHELES
jgi:hypothetical protein